MDPLPKLFRRRANSRSVVIAYRSAFSHSAAMDTYGRAAMEFRSNLGLRKREPVDFSGRTIVPIIPIEVQFPHLLLAARLLNLTDKSV